MLSRLLARTALVAMITAGCQQAPSPERGGPVDSPALGIAFDSLPRGFSVARNEGETLELEGHTEKGQGTLTVTVGPPETNINLVAAVREQRGYFEAKPGGQYFGQRELVTPWGSAFTTRGRFDDGNGGQVEEIHLFALHPNGDRRMDWAYGYTAGGDTQERMEQIIDLLGEVGPYPRPVPSEPAAEPGK